MHLWLALAALCLYDPFPVAYAESSPNKSKKVYTQAEVAQHNSPEKGVWVMYGSKVYDVTSFVEHHPGGDKILLGAGKRIEPFWSLYAFHKTPEVFAILEKYYIGEVELTTVDKKLDNSNPYANDPERHPALIINIETPFNAEMPTELLVDHLITPNELFFVRNHLPVPQMDRDSYKLEIRDFGFERKLQLNLDQIKKFPAKEVITTIQCAGNRRKDMQDASAKPGQVDINIQGIPWKHTALSTAKWKGVPLLDIMYAMLHPWQFKAGLKPNAYLLIKELEARGVCSYKIFNYQTQFCSELGLVEYNSVKFNYFEQQVRHIQFQGADGDPTIGSYGASIPIGMALDPHSEVILAYEMNGKEIPLDHGFPLRVIIPGTIGARQVKWLTNISLSDRESDSFWQQKDYKFVPPQALKSCDMTKIPAVLGFPVQSAICVPKAGQKLVNDGSIIVKGYALSGYGRGILSVEVSVDGGTTWHTASLDSASPPTSDSSEDGNTVEGTLDATNRSFRQWAWTLWQVEVPIDRSLTQVELICKARDSANGTQPAGFEGSYNVRGLLANAWHRVKVDLTPEES
ncbi:hypothetical protein Ciccas_000773 [Cichlidogyrus casuarinus]|uniref:sulfite oxidase n=1 Tax=Cichlidogyrus casuarinus TaxID=1844966 RepID=A0ABD2QPW5_9PLAT